MSKRKSSWLVSAQEQDPDVTPCSTCGGTGWNDAEAYVASGIVCATCRGFGY